MSLQYSLQYKTTVKLGVNCLLVSQLQNIVSTVNMGVKLDLKKIALHAR